MRKYDYAKAKRLVLKHKATLAQASLGMYEDWFWTAVTIWEAGKFSVKLGTPGLELAGIDGSVWATPALMLRFKDGTEKMIPCYKGKATGGRPDFLGLALGPMSKPVQKGLPPLEERKK